MPPNLKKKVLLINDHIHFGGGGDAVFRFERSVLENNGFEVFTLSFGTNDSSENHYIVKSSGSGYTNKFRKFISSNGLKNEVKRIVAEIDPDLIHIHLVSRFPLAVYDTDILKGYRVIQTLHGPNLFCATSWGGLKNSASCELGIGLKCFTRGCTSLSTAGLYWQLQKRYWNVLTEHVDLFHCPSLNILNSAKRLGLNKAEYIPLGIDPEYLNEPVKKNNPVPVLLYVGAIATPKGVQFLLPALNIIRQKFPDVKLKIAGRGELSALLQDQTEKLGLSANVELLGFVDHSKIRELYMEADIFLMPSIWQEQFGLVGPEALACKTPCVGSDVGGIPEWLKNGEHGLLIPPQDETELAGAVIKLLENKDLRMEMGEKGRAFALNYHSPLKYSENILDLVNTYIR